MAISAKFLADFSDFDRGSKEATKNLLTFEQAADRAGGRLMDLNDHADAGAPKFNTYSGSIRQFDNLLDLAGVHLRADRLAIQDLEEAAGKTVSELGLLATAGLAAGAAFVGYRFGTWIAGFEGVKSSVDGLIDAFTGFIPKAEESGAKLDVLARATATAHRTITDYTEAIKINAAEAEHLALVRGRSADAAHESFVQEAALQKELREARARGDIPALTHDLDLHILSQTALSQKYGLTTTAIQYFIDKLKAEEAASKAAQAAQAELAKGWAAFYDWAADQEAARQADLRKGFEAWRAESKAIEANAGVLDALLRQAAFDTAVAEDDARNKAAGLNAELAKVPTVAEPAANGLLSLGAAATGAAGGFFSMSAELYNAIRAAQAADAAFNKDRQASTLISGILPRAAGGPVSAGSAYLVGERGPELFRPNSSGTIIPNGAGAIAITNVFHIVDTESNIARRVSDHLTRSVMQARRLS